jgi:hypothetical protein
MDGSVIRKLSGIRSLGGILPLAIIAALAIWPAACSSNKPPAPSLASIKISPAPAGSCQIDAVKMCQVTDGGGKSAPQQAGTPIASSYMPPNMPDSLEFQIPAGQSIKLMCYYDPQHALIYRADATAESDLTSNSVDYMKKEGFCSNK